MMKNILTLWMIVWSVVLNVQASGYMFKHLEVKDGLSNNHVNDIYKDSHGYMWFATTSGLNRYDGNRITVYQNYGEGNGPFAENQINNIQEDGEGNLWIGTNTGYSVYDVETECFNRDLTQRMTQMGMSHVPKIIYIDKQKDFYFYVLGVGCFMYCRQTQKLHPALFARNQLPAGEITDISECSEGILLSYDTGLIVCMDRTTNQICWQLDEISDSNTKTIQSLYVDRDDDIWVYSTLGTWVYSLSAKKWQPELAAKVRGSNTDMVQAVVQAKDGRIWVGRDQKGICILDKHTGETTTLVHKEGDERSLQNNSVLSLYEDSNGIMWVGTYKKGVSYYDESIFKFAVDHVGDVNCVEEDKDGWVWLGTNDEGLIRWNRKTGAKQTFVHGGVNSISNNVVVSLKKASDGKLWIGTFRGGLDCYDNGRFIHYRHQSGNPNSLACDDVWALDEDRNGNIWIGTLGAGVQCLNPRTGKFLSFNTSSTDLALDYISSVQVTKDNRLLVATAHGMSELDLNTHKISNYWGTRSGKKEFSCMNINQAYKDSRGLIWLATREGLNVYDAKNDSLLVLTEEDGMSSQLITGIVEDRNKNIWVATANGLTNILPVPDIKTGRYVFQYQVYTDMDGLQNCEFNMRSINCMTDGEVILGGMYGVNYFYPDKICYNQLAPRVLFTQLSLFNEAVEVGQVYDGRVILDNVLNAMSEIELDYAQNVFSIQFASDNFILPEKVKYVYKLEGFNSDWLTTHVAKITYTNLSSGTYTLKVKAINSDGFCGSESCLRIVIRPPFWLTGWAFFIYAMLIVGGLLLARYLLFRSAHNKFRIQQMEQEAEKNKEVNDMKLRFFTNVSHELRTPLTLIISPLEVLMKDHQSDKALVDKLEVMHRNASRLMVLVNQLLDFRRGDVKGHQLNLSEGDVVSYTSNICHSFTSMTEKKNVHLTFFSAMPSLRMSFDSDKYHKIVMNLLSNAFKFTPEGGRVDVAVSLQKVDSQEMLELKVSDTGIGIKDEDKERVFDRFYQVEASQADTSGSGVGLSLVRDFVCLHEGTVKVMDNVPAGSIFIVHLPVRKSLEAEEVSNESKVEWKETMELPKDGHAVNMENTALPIILLVDDNEDFLHFMSDSLKDKYRVRTAVNGKLAWTIVQEQKPDLIVSDVMMPEMDGNELCRLVKGNRETEHISFILLTAYLSNEYRLEGLTAGADDYMTKPFSINILFLRIKKLLELHSYSKRTKIDPTPSEIEITSLDEILVENAVKYVEENMSKDDFSVEELSQGLGMSRVHLYKKLVAITGKTPIEFIRLIRLKRAAQLLRESQLNVSEIAYQVGFNSPKYFSKYFKEEFGVLPSTYQNVEGK